MAIRNIVQYHLSTDDFSQQSGIFQIKIQRPNINGKFLNKIALQDICFPRAQNTFTVQEATFQMWSTTQGAYLPIVLQSTGFYTETTFPVELKSKLDAAFAAQAPNFIIAFVAGKIKITDNNNPGDSFRFQQLQPDMINVFGFSQQNFNQEEQYYFLDGANDRTSPGLFNLNSVNGYYFLECEQVKGGYNNRGSSQILSHVYLHTIPNGAYFIQTYDVIENMRDFTNNSDYLSIRIRDKNNKIVTLSDLNNVDVQFSVSLFQYD